MRPYDNTAQMNGQTHPRRTLRLSGDPFWDLVATAKRLQAPGGCAWDRAQTLQSLVPHLIEETWEVFEAVRSRRPRHLQEELGDVLYTVLFLALIAERRGFADLRTLLDATRRKMVRRHPHVFGTRYAATPRDAYQRGRQPNAVSRGVLRPPAQRPFGRCWLAGGMPCDGTRKPPASCGGRSRDCGRLTDDPNDPVPGERERQPDREAQHHIGSARIKGRKHRFPLVRDSSKYSSEHFDAIVASASVGGKRNFRPPNAWSIPPTSPAPAEIRQAEKEAARRDAGQLSLPSEMVWVELT